MKMRTIGGVVVFAALAGSVLAQSGPSASVPVPAGVTASAPAALEIADIHPSPRRRYAFFDGGFLENGRYILHQATMVDLITTAYGVKDPTYVHGGPSWLEWNRWDVIAKVPPGTTGATAKLMLQTLLAQRFGLVVHTGSAPMPAYLLTAPGGKSKLTESDGSSQPGCQGHPPSNPDPRAIQLIWVTCHNETMEQFAEEVHLMAGGYLTQPVVDATSLTGAYDFDLKWTGRGQLLRAGTDGISIFDAVEKQLGLKLTLQTAPRPVMIVDSVKESPTPNVPNLASIMPPLPPAEFEVATIKPSAPDERENGRIVGGMVNFQAIPLRDFIMFVWNLDPNDHSEIVNAPGWMDGEKIDVMARVANVAQGSGPGHPPIAIDDLREMLRALLVERFEMKVHMEDKPTDAYDLVAVKPRLTPADPDSRTSCHEGPGPDGKDPRTSQPLLNMLVTCQNVTMAQAGEMFPQFAAYYLYYPAEDKTGLSGGWNFTLSWSSGDNMPNFNGGGGSAQAQNGNIPSDPSGVLSFYDAVSKELGLKLVKVKRPEPVLVIDHIDQQPLPN